MVAALEQALASLQASAARDADDASLRLTTLSDTLAGERARAAQLQAQLATANARASAAEEAEIRTQQVLAACQKVRMVWMDD
jgi:hypothetical protein